jgi:hypothetical protein
MPIYSIRSQIKSHRDSILMVGRCRKVNSQKMAVMPLGMKQTEKNFKHKKKPKIKS